MLKSSKEHKITWLQLVANAATKMGCMWVKDNHVVSGNKTWHVRYVVDCVESEPKSKMDASLSQTKIHINQNSCFLLHVWV